MSPRRRREVHLVLRIARAHFRHRADRTVRGIDRDDGRSRIGCIGQRAPNRLEREALEPRVDRRVDAQPTRAHRVRAILPHQHVAHVAEEVRLADAGVKAAGLEVEVASRDRVRVLARIDVVVVQHGAEHLVATRDRIGRTVERVEVRRVAEAERAAQVNARTLQSRLRPDEPLNRSKGHNILQGRESTLLIAGLQMLPPTIRVTFGIAT